MVRPLEPTTTCCGYRVRLRENALEAEMGTGCFLG